jgi:hypothetical protein
MWKEAIVDKLRKTPGISLKILGKLIRHFNQENWYSEIHSNQVLPT